MSDAGIEDMYMTELAGHLKPDSSAMFVQASTDRLSTLLLEMKPAGGRIIKTTLNPFNEENLREAHEGKLDELMD